MLFNFEWALLIFAGCSGPVASFKNAQTLNLRVVCERRDGLRCSAAEPGDHRRGSQEDPPDLRNRYSPVDWHGIAGLRDVHAHAYFGLDDETLWGIVQEKVPQLILVLREILDRHDAEEE